MIAPLALSVGIVTYESRIDVFKELLESLHNAASWLSARRPATTTIYVVSNDPDIERSAAVADAVNQAACCSGKAVEYKLIQGQGNIGYGAAQNLAIEQTTSDYHLVLNPDVVVARDALEECVSFLEAAANTVMLTPQGFDSGENYASLAKRDPSVLVLLLRALSVRPSGSPWGRRVGRYIYSDRLPSTEPEIIDHASGCFMFCRTKQLQAVGGFDPHYFLYFEDYDLSKRISQHGYIYELPTVRIRHYGGMTVHRGWRRIRHFIMSAAVFFNHYGWRLI